MLKKISKRKPVEINSSKNNENIEEKYQKCVNFIKGLSLSKYSNEQVKFLLEVLPSHNIVYVEAYFIDRSREFLKEIGE